MENGLSYGKNDMDTLTKKKRSLLMGKIKSKETTIEKVVRKVLWENGIKYRKNSSKHFGKPDIIISPKKIVVFVDSCFWHGCKKHCRIPKSNTVFWITKITNNKKRDKVVSNHYKKIGWKVIRIWEHDIEKKFEKTFFKIIEFLREK